MEIVSVNKLKVDPKTGEIELRYNQTCIDSDFYLVTRREESKKTLFKKIIDFFFKRKPTIEMNNITNSKITINNK